MFIQQNTANAKRKMLRYAVEKTLKKHTLFFHSPISIAPLFATIETASPHPKHTSKEFNNTSTKSSSS
jgi:hypothetical protein